MQAVHIALFILCIQCMGWLCAESGIYSDVIYSENMITDFETTSSPAQTEEEQVQASIFGLENIWSLLTWDWIKMFFGTWYTDYAGVRTLIDTMRIILTSITSLCVTVAIIEFVRNQTNILGK